MATLTTQPSGIMNLVANSLPKLCLVMGAPERAKKCSELLKDVKVIAMNREYHTYTGTWKGVPITVASHGVGGGGASMAFEELIAAGCKTIIRAGTCGSISSKYREASLIVATASVREDGVSNLLVPVEYPAVADYQVVESLLSTLKGTNIIHGAGIVVTAGNFYDGVLGNKNDIWVKANVLAIEMEISVLFVIASLRGIRAGAILNVDNYIYERKEYEPNKAAVVKGTEKMLEVALDSLIKLA